MSEDTFRWVVAAGVTLAALCIVVQAIVVLVLFSVIKKTQAKVLAFMERAEPIVDSVKGIVDDLKPKIAAISTDATDVVKMGKEQVERLSVLVKDFSDRAKVQVARLDGAVDDTLEQVQSASTSVKDAVMQPVRKVNGLFAGVRTALSVYSQGTRASVDHATQDEEMFI